MNVRKNKPSIERMVTQALRAAGCLKPDEMARLVLRAVGNNENLNSILEEAEEKHGDAAPRPSTIVGRLNEADRRTFVKTLNNACRRLARALLTNYPPQQRPLLLVDVREAEYFETVERNKRIAWSASRQSHAMKATADNKRSNMAHYWLVMMLHWTHGDQPFDVVIHQELLHRLTANPKRQTESVEWVLRRLPVKPLVIMDRGYDASAVRNALTSAGADLLVRLRVHGPGSPWVELEDGQRTRLTDLVASTAERRPISAGRWRGHPYAYVPLQVRARVSSDAAFGYLTIHAALKRGQDKAGIPTWIGDFGSSFVVFSTLALPDAVRTYGKRWRIESFFEDLVKDPGDPRPKTLTSHVIQTATSVLRWSLARVAKAMALVSQALRLQHAPRSRARRTRSLRRIAKSLLPSD